MQYEDNQGVETNAIHHPTSLKKCVCSEFVMSAAFEQLQFWKLPQTVHRCILGLFVLKCLNVHLRCERMCLIHIRAYILFGFLLIQKQGLEKHDEQQNAL